MGRDVRGFGCCRVCLFPVALGGVVCFVGYACPHHPPFFQFIRIQLGMFYSTTRVLCAGPTLRPLTYLPIMSTIACFHFFFFCEKLLERSGLADDGLRG